jgi:hypothetical protein
MDTMMGRSERMLAIVTIEAAAEGTEAMTAVPFAKAIAMSEAVSDKVEATAGQVAADKTPAVGITIAISEETAAARTAAMRSQTSTAQTSRTAMSINRAITRGKNAARIRATRSLLTVVSMKAIISSMMMTLSAAPRAAAAGAATIAVRARAAAVLVLTTTTLEPATPCLQRKSESLAKRLQGLRKSRHASQLRHASSLCSSSALSTKPLAARRNKHS